MRDIIDDMINSPENTATILYGCCLVFEDIQKCEKTLPVYFYFCLMENWVYFILIKDNFVREPRKYAKPDPGISKSLNSSESSKKKCPFSVLWNTQMNKPIIYKIEYEFYLYTVKFI